MPSFLVEDDTIFSLLSTTNSSGKSTTGQQSVRTLPQTLQDVVNILRNQGSDVTRAEGKSRKNAKARRPVCSACKSHVSSPAIWCAWTRLSHQRRWTSSHTFDDTGRDYSLVATFYDLLLGEVSPKILLNDMFFLASFSATLICCKCHPG